MATDELSDRLFEHYPQYRESRLVHRRFTQADLLPLIEQRKADPVYKVETVGHSYENRRIQMLTRGAGPRKILLWTQMHGDEPTATMAVFDLLNFLEASGDGFDSLRNLIARSLTLHIVPMLNPDGAERYQRRSAQEIDLNRDALALQAPESRLLKSLQQSLHPEFGFNMHDKNPRYSVGHTQHLATMSFLATAYDRDRNLNEVRKKSMQLIVAMNRTLQKYIPGQVGKWDETFEPRAFGDNIQKWGTSLVLIESGGYAGDPEKQYIRKLNFIALLVALESIASNAFVLEELRHYHALLENSRFIFDLLIRNATVNDGATSFQTDVGIDRIEVNTKNGRSFYHRSGIEEYGDLSIFFGTETFDATGLALVPGKCYPETIADVAGLSDEAVWNLLQQGYTHIKTSGKVAAGPVHLPLHILPDDTRQPAQPVAENPATFLLTKNGVPAFAVVNGFIYDLSGSYVLLGNGIVEG